MTAPAEDPRGGEGHNHVTRDIKPVGTCPACDEYWGTNWGIPRPPAAGRGDTDSGGECRHVGKRGLDCDCEPAPPAAARPAGDRAQPTQELREAIARWEFARRAPARYWGSGALDSEEADARSAADELLALPALAALLDAQAAVNRVEAAMTAWNRCEPVGGYLPREIRRALGGTT